MQFSDQQLFRVQALIDALPPDAGTEPAVAGAAGSPGPVDPARSDPNPAGPGPGSRNLDPAVRPAVQPAVRFVRELTERLVEEAVAWVCPASLVSALMAAYGSQRLGTVRALICRALQAAHWAHRLHCIALGVSLHEAASSMAQHVEERRRPAKLAEEDAFRFMLSDSPAPGPDRPGPGPAAGADQDLGPENDMEPFEPVPVSSTGVLLFWNGDVVAADPAH